MGYFSDCLNCDYNCDGQIFISLYFRSSQFILLCVSFLSRVDELHVWVFIAQLVEHCSANTEAIGSNPVEAPKFFFYFGLLRNCLNCGCNCEGHIFVSFETSSQALSVISAIFMSQSASCAEDREGEFQGRANRAKKEKKNRSSTENNTLH